MHVLVNMKVLSVNTCVLCAALSRTPAASLPRYSEIGSDVHPTSTAVIPWHEQYPFGKTLMTYIQNTVFIKHRVNMEFLNICIIL